LHEALTAAASVDELKKRYGDINACYRLLAKKARTVDWRAVIEGEPPIERLSSS
jgi:hypothetical protein